MGTMQQVNKCNKQFDSGIGTEFYKGYEINSGTLHGQIVWEAYNPDMQFGFFRLSYQLLKEAINQYQFNQPEIIN